MLIRAFKSPPDVTALDPASVGQPLVGGDFQTRPRLHLLAIQHAARLRLRCR